MDLELERKRLISRAHVLKNQIGMSEDDFKQLKTDSTGVPSLRMMDILHLRSFVAAIEKIKSSKDAPASLRRLSDGQYRKIIKLAKYVLKWNDGQIKGFIERETGKADISWLTAREAYNVTEALSSIIERSRGDVRRNYDGTTRHKKKAD